MKSKITILVNSCDSYNDLWDIFFKLFKKYWPDCAYRIILNTESKSYTYDGLNIEYFQFYPEGSKAPYGERILKHLNEISTDYTLMLMDDFFLRDFVKVDKLLQCLKWMENNEKIVAFYFTPLLDKNNTVSQEYTNFEKRPQYGEFKLSFMPALWRTKKLASYWREHESPWQWEEIGNFRTVNHKQDEFYAICENAQPIINFGHNKERCWGVVQGKWAKKNVEKLFEENNIYVDYSKRGIFTETDRELLCKTSRLKRWVDEYKSIKGTGLEWILLEYKVMRRIRATCGLKSEPWCSYFSRKGV